jgi:hypothetical protein
MLSDYGYLIDYFYETSLSWAYNPDNNPLPQEDIEQVLAHHKNLDMEAFLGTSIFGGMLLKSYHYHSHD